jgi:glycosyltransferase involved in cell wall biosynthesis
MQVSDRAVFHVDYTHMGRRSSGIERITGELFNSQALSPLDVRPYTASGSRPGVVVAQMVGLPLCAIRKQLDIFIFPGFPPSPYFSFARDRSVLYVHDLFLLTRRNELNRAGKYYMAPMFSIAINNFRYFLANSEATARNLRIRCDPTATIVLYRPAQRNVFGLEVGDRARRTHDPAKLRVVSIGTIEPRKNFLGAADICEALSAQLKREVELHIIGRFGWGDAADKLSKRPNIRLHGYLSDAEARSIIEASDIFLCTSHQEGLGLPLLEVQYCGMPVVAPDDVVFRESLGASGIFVDPSSPKRAADLIVGKIAAPSWRLQYVEAAAANIAIWNAIAESDRRAVISFLSDLASNLRR